MPFFVGWRPSYVASSPSLTPRPLHPGIHYLTVLSTYLHTYLAAIRTSDQHQYHGTPSVPSASHPIQPSIHLSPVRFRRRRTLAMGPAEPMRARRAASFPHLCRPKVPLAATSPLFAPSFVYLYLAASPLPTLGTQRTRVKGRPSAGRSDRGWGQGKGKREREKKGRDSASPASEPRRKKETAISQSRCAL